ncbi:MAG: type II toxin-antitoxin system PemK/MazF family toxin [Parcubacteria group bacterium]|nr:type II toxin-antitoxin system PemK/MazF family toxin [Parcubacteria group bacterium]
MAQEIKIPVRGEIYLVGFDPAFGSEIKKTRPALIVQNNISNKYSPTTIVAAITSVTGGRGYSTNVFLKESQSGLKQDSVVLLNQIKTIDKQRLIKKIGVMDQALMADIDRALEISLGLVKI